MNFKIYRLFLILGDIFLLFFSLFLVVFLRFKGNIEQFKIHFNYFLPIFVFFILTSTLIRSYRIDKSLSAKEFFKKNFTSIITTFIFSFIYFYLFGGKISPKKNLLIFWILFLIFDTFFKRKFANYFYFKRPKINLLLLGQRKIFERLLKDLQRNLHLGFNVFFIKSFGKASEIPEPKIIVIPPNFDVRKIIDEKNYQEEITKVKTIKDFYENVFEFLPIEYLSKIDILNIANKDRLIYNFFKRLIDLIFGFILMIIFILTFPFIALGIKLSSPGPIFFKQKRVGKSEKEIEIIKFRTLHQEKKDVWIGKDEGLIFPFGKFLRKFHLDELPQAINILKGDLTLVGPRPEQVKIVSELKEKIPYYSLRHLVKPGLTGWAQINIGKYPSVEWTKKKLEYDLFYIKNQNLFLDLIIIFHTLRVLLETSKSY